MGLTTSYWLSITLACLFPLHLPPEPFRRWPSRCDVRKAARSTIATRRSSIALYCNTSCKRLRWMRAAMQSTQLLLHFGHLLLLLLSSLFLQTTLMAVAILACLAFAQADGEYAVSRVYRIDGVTHSC